MDQPPVSPASNAQPGPVEPPKKKGLGCLGILAIIVGIFAVLLLILGIMVWQAVTWIKNAPEAAMPNYPKLALSEGEQEDVERIIGRIDQANKANTVAEEHVTPAVFNGIIDWLQKEEARRGKTKSDAPLVFRGAFNGDNLEVKATFPATDPDSKQKLEGKYVNVDVLFDVEIVEGEITKADVKHLKLAGKDMPMLARGFVNSMVAGVKEASKQAKQRNDPNDPMKWLQAIKLLKREGDRLHVIIDGSKFDEDKK